MPSGPRISMQISSVNGLPARPPVAAGQGWSNLTVSLAEPQLAMAGEQAAQLTSAVAPGIPAAAPVASGAAKTARAVRVFSYLGTV